MFIRYALSVVVPATALLAWYLMLSLVSRYREALVGQGAAPLAIPSMASLKKQ